MGLRINKYFTVHAICSRREADRYVDEGRITINGVKAKPGDRVQEGDKVALDGKVVRSKKRRLIVIAYHKPMGVECTSNPDVEDNIIQAVGHPDRLFHVGRLDKMSEGLILLTNEGDLVNAVLRKVGGHEKEYLVYLNAPISDEQLKKLRDGIDLEDGPTLPAKVDRLDDNRVLMTLTEGRNRQIRRMVEAVGLKTSRLKRVRFLNIVLGSLPRDKWRDLRPDELKDLLTLAGLEEKF